MSRTGTVTLVENEDGTRQVSIADTKFSDYFTTPFDPDKAIIGNGSYLVNGGLALTGAAIGGAIVDQRMTGGNFRANALFSSAR